MPDRNEILVGDFTVIIKPWNQEVRVCGEGKKRAWAFAETALNATREQVLNKEKVLGKEVIDGGGVPCQFESPARWKSIVVYDREKNISATLA